MTSNPATPRLSSTILLVRDSTAQFEVLMVKRHYEIDFASGALVFPGGKACDDDSNTVWESRAEGRVVQGGRAAMVAAIRELFEEAGVLLARSAETAGVGQPLVGPDRVTALQPHRGPVDRGEMLFSQLIEDEDLVLALDCLVHFGHWITPEMMPKRFDTHFYVAAAPPDQLATQDGRETTEAVWLAPGLALDMAQRDEATIIFPTRMNLGRLALAKSVGDALEQFAASPAPTVLPVVDSSGADGPELVIPYVEGYGQTREPIGRVANVMKSKPG